MGEITNLIPMDDKEQLLKLYQDMYEAMIHKEESELDRVHEDTFVLVHMSGMQQNKQEYIKSILNGTLNYYSSKLEHVDIQIQDHKAEMIGHSIVKASVFGGGCPINMNDFHLFDKEHRSSYPLNIAYEAVKLIDVSKAETFLKALAHATIVETRQTTKIEEILKVAEKVGVDTDAFKECLNSEEVEKAFQKDLEYRASIGIYSLPAYLIQRNGKSIIVKSLLGVEEFKRVISTL